MNIHWTRDFFCLDCTFKNCPGQLAKLCSLYVDSEAHRMESTYNRFFLHIYRTERKQQITVRSGDTKK